MKNYTLLEHTADIAVRVRAGDLKGLFRNTARAMFDIIAEKQSESKKKKKIAIKQQADTLDELFVNWLNELLSLSATKELIFSDFKINKLTEKNLEATLSGESVKNYKMNTEIKAATYHQLKIEKSAKGWQGEVIFDV
jgi:SHS2 domain-containing protein